MDADAARRARAQARQKTAILRRGTLERYESDLHPLAGAAAVSLVARLTTEAWSLSGRELPLYTRESIPCAFVPGRLT